MTAATLPPPQDASYNHQCAQINGIRMHFIDVGPRDAIPLVLVHGFPDLWYGWKHQIASLRTKYRVIAADSRGFGETDAPVDAELYRRKTVADDFAKLLDHLEIKQAVFIGHDWGGDLVWRMCNFHPDRVLAVASVCTPYFPTMPTKVTLHERVAAFPEFEYQLTFAAPETTALYDANMANFLHMMYSHGTLEDLAGLAKSIPNQSLQGPHPELFTADEFQYYVDQYSRQGFQGPLNWYRTAEYDWEDLAHKPLAGISHEALFIAASQDLVLRPSLSEHMEKFIPRLTRRLVEGGTHWVLHDKPDQVNAILHEWLATVTSTP
ncbi:unnamed protein product [Aphanomyces euteiches]|uniref:AB hydrolase-1 domain-containing protein n=1 Tax=Aphanomyces euteiches TaxID=100861 RepID=A0A6G0WSD0_9STRA|nr:hypothetical protein Ae201684_012323 [Aphanomyces euteiches]KAH9096684.1 hypothetical protein Ae201684P_013350 [Aphanomyces euteiches]KAH9157222.1 hypothetical protein AeRB84_000897 [Aphanomyces euteiches]